MITALVPLKAHSERVPGKNFKRFVNKPLFQWILHTLLEIEQIEQIVINTDAEQLLVQHGLELTHPKVLLRDRKPELCGDFVSMNKVLADDVVNTNATLYLMTHVTNPLLSKKSIETCIEKFLTAQKTGVDSLFTVTKHQTRFYDEAARPINHDPKVLLRTQDLPPYFEENSCLYLFSKASFLSTNARIGKHPMMQEIPKIEAIDIDTPEEWQIGEAIAKHLMSSKA